MSTTQYEQPVRFHCPGCAVSLPPGSGGAHRHCPRCDGPMVPDRRKQDFEFPVAVLGGTGALGAALVARLTAAGIPVVIGSRHPAAVLDAPAGPRQDGSAAEVTVASNRDAAGVAEVVFLCVPFAAHAQTLKGIAAVMRDEQVLVDTTVPLAAAVGGEPIRMLGVPQGSAAEQARDLMPAGTAVVAALHTVSAAHLADPAHTLSEDVLIAGDSRQARRRVAALLGLIPGLRPVECGPLHLARTLESLTPMLISINRRLRTSAGVRLTGLSGMTW